MTARCSRGSGSCSRSSRRRSTMPLSVDLRYGAVTAIDLARQLVIVAGIVALVAAGAGLLPFFVVYVAAGVVAIVVGARVRRRAAAGSLPRFAWREWRPLLWEAAPIALSSVVNVTYVRTLIILASLLATAEQTGLFATSYRISEILLGVPQLMIGAAFPILVHSGVADEQRLAYVLPADGRGGAARRARAWARARGRAAPIVQLLGGSAYADAASVLRIQSVAIAAAFMTQRRHVGLVAVLRQRALCS